MPHMASRSITLISVQGPLNGKRVSGSLMTLVDEVDFATLVLFYLSASEQTHAEFNALSDHLKHPVNI